MRYKERSTATAINWLPPSPPSFLPVAVYYRFETPKATSSSSTISLIDVHLVHLPLSVRPSIINFDQKERWRRRRRQTIVISCCCSNVDVVTPSEKSWSIDHAYCDYNSTCSSFFSLIGKLLTSFSCLDSTVLHFATDWLIRLYSTMFYNWWGRSRHWWWLWPVWTNEGLLFSSNASLCVC